MYNGVLLVDKPPGMTSHDVVNIIRKIFGQKKVGHAGTLDKPAVGLLIILLGKATKLAEFLMSGNKTYTAEVSLGTTTDSDDSTGSILSKKPCNISRNQVLQALNFFKGEINQLPPRLSAVHIGGQRLYKLTKKGVEAELPLRRVEIITSKMLDFAGGDYPNFTIKVECSKGTYIRSLARDIGERLYCGGHISFLRRDQSGRFSLKDAYSLEKIEESVKSGKAQKLFVDAKDVLADYHQYKIKKEWESSVMNGKKLTYEMFETVEPVESEVNIVVSSMSGEPLAIMKSNDHICRETADKKDQLPLKYLKVIA